MSSRISRLKDTATEVTPQRDNRVSWHTIWMDMARNISRRSTCPRAAVGAALVDHDQQILISLGYNGAPHGTPHCADEGCIVDPSTQSCVRSVHAEINAILHAGGHTKDAYLYCTHSPCYRCAQAIVQSRIACVIVDKIYVEPDARLDPIGLLEEAGILVPDYEYIISR